jgi:hypothetical protein
MLSMTPPIWIYAEMRISISSSNAIIQVRIFKFVNDNSNSTNLKVNLLDKTQFLFIAESPIDDTTGDTGWVLKIFSERNKRIQINK